MATKKKPLDHGRLKRLADEIAAPPSGPNSDLIRRMQVDDGLKIAEVPKGSGTTRVTMAGISATSTAGPLNALVNWGNKARRTLNSAA